MSSSITSLLADNLGEYSIRSKGNLAFYCPFCRHYKQKLEVHPDRQQWNCWVCGAKGRTIFSLFKKLKVDQFQFERLFEILPNSYKFKDYIDEEDNLETFIELPKEYIPLWVNNSKNFYYKTALKYIQSRGITMGDIFKYRIGYCEGGMYDGMLIFPNYNKDGKLTYMTNRSFLQSNYKKFINPPVNRNVVGFELQLNYDFPLILCESALDAMTIRVNASPLYGKFLSKSLKLTILENEIKKIILCLDPDAIQKSYEHSEYFLSNGITVYFVEIPDSFDVNKLGFDEIWKRIKSSRKMSEYDIFKNKVLKAI